MDRQQWGIAPYKEADLQAQLDGAQRFYGAEGVRAVGLVNDHMRDCFNSGSLG